LRNPRACGLTFIIVALIASQALAEPPDDSCAVHWVLAALESRDPVSDAQSAIKRGGPQFMGLYGYSLETPGVKADPYCLRDAGLLWVIPDTSDDLRCEEHHRLQAVARSYVLAFNGELISTNGVAVPAKCLQK